MARQPEKAAASPRGGKRPKVKKQSLKDLEARKEAKGGAAKRIIKHTSGPLN